MRLPVVRAVLGLNQARTGITIRAAAVMAMPLKLGAGRTPRMRDRIAVQPTMPARTKSKTPAHLAARSFETRNAEEKERITKTADSISTRLSAPNARSAALRAELAE